MSGKKLQNVRISDCNMMRLKTPSGARIAQSVKRFVFVWRLATYLFHRGSNRAGGMLAKNIGWWKKHINENPCGMYEWFDCPCRVAVVSQSISRAAENYPGFPPPQDRYAKCIFRSRIALFDVDSVSIMMVTVLYHQACWVMPTIANCNLKKMGDLKTLL